MRRDRADIRPVRVAPGSGLLAVGMGGLGLILLAATMIGCGLPDYEVKPENLPAAYVTPHSQWRVKAEGNIGDAAKTIDENRSTVALSGRAYANSSLTVDLGKACLFNMVVIDHGSNEFGFAGKVEVATSLDGRRFRVQQTEPGTRRVSIISLITPTLARYVRIRAVTEGREPWSVAEIYVE